MSAVGRLAPVAAAVAVVAVVVSVALVVRAGQGQQSVPADSVATEVADTVTPSHAAVPIAVPSAEPTSAAPTVTAPTVAAAEVSAAPTTPAQPHAFVRFVNHDPDYPVVFRAGDLTVGPLPSWTVTEFHVVDRWTSVSMTVPGHPECADSASSTSESPAGHWVVSAEPRYGQADCRGELTISADDPVGVGLSHPVRWSRAETLSTPGEAPRGATGDQPSSTTSAAAS